ncbi:hypothetical protein [Acidovorax cavernicola]|uniref:Uncharacterized protein n=1 Tax=Acidovorax cavernicola TaxID=1675792 RepID=A0A9X8D8T4_9BURK|nr:hypothetical protein [Acidovorax cavernicola]RIX84875.1 hypothetical protein D3H34_04465 [Acidovorax cavernicola]
MRSRVVDVAQGLIVLGPWAAMFAYLGLAPLAAHLLDGTQLRTGPSRGSSYWWTFSEAVADQYPLLTWLLGLQSHVVLWSCLAGMVIGPIVAWRMDRRLRQDH